MYHIVVIGAGQLGSRHLQGLAKNSLPTTLHIVDPSAASRENAKFRIHEVGLSETVEKIFEHSIADTLPDYIDLAIIATTSTNRLEAMRRLCLVAEVKYLVLEKILFQRLSEYQQAADMLAKAGIRCWVNCPRRMYYDYKEIKSFFSDDAILSLQVHGGEWGLGCNGIHFIDLLGFLAGNGETYVSTAGAFTAKPSKRQGFMEYAGSLMGHISNAQFFLTALNQSMPKHLITIRSKNKSIMIDEVGGWAWQIGLEQNKVFPFTVPMQSQLSAELAESILTTGGCELTTFQESAAYHIPFIRALAQQGQEGNIADICYIT